MTKSRLQDDIDSIEYDIEEAENKLQYYEELVADYRNEITVLRLKLYQLKAQK